LKKSTSYEASHYAVFSNLTVTSSPFGPNSSILNTPCWCDIIVLYVHAPREDKIDDIKNRFYEELEHVFDKFPKYHMKILLGDFNA
jgi:hypothetical protein